MDLVNAISSIISNVGFPIACVIAMFWQMENERKAHKEESDMWVEAVNRNTQVLERLSVLMEGDNK